MKVKDLIKKLSMMEQDSEVHFSYNYGDHWRTQVAPEVESVEEGIVTYSDYHNMYKVEDDEDEIYDEETSNYKKSVHRVVILG